MAINGVSFFRTHEVANLTIGEAAEADYMVGELLRMSEEFRELVARAKVAVLESNIINQTAPYSDAPYGVRFNEARGKFFVNGQK